MPEKAKKNCIWREDPHGDKEDTRPVELRKKPRLSLTWEQAKGMLDIE